MNCLKIVQFVAPKLISNAPTIDAFQSKTNSFRLLVELDLFDDYFFFLFWFLTDNGHVISLMTAEMGPMKRRHNVKENIVNVLNQNSVAATENVFHPGNNNYFCFVLFHLSFEYDDWELNKILNFELKTDGDATMKTTVETIRTS